MKKVLKTLVKILILVFTFFSGLITSTVIWLCRDWAEMSATELIFHMGQSLSGANPEVIKNYVFKYVLITVLVMIIAIMVAIVAHKKAKAKIVYILYVIGSLGLCIFACYLMETRMGLLTYIKYRIQIEVGKGEDYIGENYVDPRNVELEFPETKRNLIFIFLESMEMTYTDTEHGGAFSENTIPELTELALMGEDFSSEDNTINGAVSLQGTNWTMGGMFAESAGIPLQLTIDGNGMEGRDDFFPNIVTLGDILEENGYNQELMIGSEAKFGGRDIYYKQHGNYRILDYNWAIEEGKIPEEYFVWWGYEDEKLFEFAREELQQLSQNDEPFNLTLLTVDTHFEDGYVCELCKDEFDGNQYANVFSCSSRQVYDFVSWIQKQPFYDNTTIILSGDHPTMDTDFCKSVDKEYQRRTYFNVINGKASRKTDGNREYTTMDIFPTTLAALGVEIPGDRLGLGTNLYADKETMLEKYDALVLDEYNGRPSAFLLEQSKVSISAEDLDKVKYSKFSYATLDDGNLIFSLSKILGIHKRGLEKAEIVFTNKKTGDIKSYDMRVEEDKVLPNAFSVIAETEISDDELDEYRLEIFFTVKGIDHYKVYEWEQSEE